MPPLPGNLALRIALAARSAPGLDPARLLQALIAACGEPLTESKLASLRKTRLRQCLRERVQPPLPESVFTLGDDGWTRMLGLLRGRGVPPADAPLPPVEDYREGDMPGSVRIACASATGEKLDGGFPDCPRFLIYQVSPTQIRLIDTRSPEGGGSREERLARRVACIADCRLLYTVSIGGPAAARVVKAGAHVIRTGTPRSARSVALELQQVLAHAPPPWLARAMGVAPAGARCHPLEEEG